MGPSIGMASPSENDSPLHSAVRQGQLEEVRRLLDKSDIDVNCVNANHETPLHLACALNYSSIIEILIAFGANVFVKDSDNKDCYDRMNTEICKLVNKLLYCQNLWLECLIFIDKDGPLHSAVKLGQLETVQDILDQRRVGINDKNLAQETPLHIACTVGNSGIVHLLIINGASTCERDGYNNAPIHRAAAMGHIDIVDMLVTEFGCNPNIRGYQGRSLLHIACGSGNIKIVVMLVQRKFLDPVNDRDACGLTPLHIAALCGHEKIMNMLIGTFNCPVDCQDSGAFTPLHLACISGHINIVELLVLDHNATLNICNFQNDLPLHLAAQFGHVSVVKTVIEVFNCNQNETGFMGTTILHKTCKNGYVELAETLIIDFGLDPMCVDDNKNTPLHYAAYGGHLSVVNMLVSRHNADVNARNNQNELPLHVAARRGHTTIVKAFINDFNCIPNEKGFEGKTILYEASINGHVELVETLITDFGLDPMCVDDDKYTPLHSAALGGHNNIAAKVGHTDVVNVMINELNRKVKDKGLQSQTALSTFSQACEEGYEDLAITLITDLVCLSPLSADSDGNTLLHIAAMHGQERCVSLLLNVYNAPVYVRNNAGRIAREVTESSRIREIFDNYLKQNVRNIQVNYKKLQHMSSKKYSGEQRLTRVFVVGNILSGKSTLIESLKREGFFTSFGQVSDSIVPLHTSGIIPSVHDSKTIGRILYYDFAGDPQYYSSHSAILSNITRSKAGTNVFLVVLNFIKDISNIQEELGYWLCFISHHSRCASESRCTVTVMIIGSHVDCITSADKNRKINGISKFTQAYFSKISPGPVNFELYHDTLTLNCRRPRSAQGMRNAIFQISKCTQPFNLSPEAAILLGLLEKDFKNVVSCDIQGLLAHICYTNICLPTTVENLYPVLEQLHNVGLLMIIGRHNDKLEDHIILLNISKLTNEVHELLFSDPTIDDDPNLHAQLSMGVLPQSYLKDILPEYITSDCLVQLQYCQPFDHFEVKFDHVAPANHECYDSTLFYFPALCKSERKESIVTPDSFNYYIRYFAECKTKLEYFPPRFLHLLFLRLAYSYALQAVEENTITSDVESIALLQIYNRRCTMWRNGIHWLMQEGVECFIESVNNSKAIVVITKSKEKQKSTCSEMLFKILREFQQVKDEVCESLALQQYVLDSDNPSSCSDRDKLFEMSQVEQVLSEGKPSIVSINGKGHMDAEKIVHFMKCTLWGKYYDVYEICIIKYIQFVGQFFPLSIKDILKCIVTIVGNWKMLGIQLNVSQHILEEIRANNPHNVVACKTQMISKWMDSESLATPSCWWSLVKAVKDMDENLIARKIGDDHSEFSV